MSVAEEPARGSNPVVLELFTAQGCSSCPAADELLSRLALDARTRALVVPLAFHVDYWNELGWVDPFSARGWSLRQDAYKRALKSGHEVYTPQLVVNGEAELNGADAQRVLHEIDAALGRASRARLHLDVRLDEGGRPALSVAVGAEGVEGIDARKLELLVALVENNLVTSVGRGENGGRTLRNDFVVRRLSTASSFEPGKGAPAERRLVLKLERQWKTENLGVAAFLQDPSSMRIHAAASIAPIVGSEAQAR
jgi:hypothetical protein